MLINVVRANLNNVVSPFFAFNSIQRDSVAAVAAPVPHIAGIGHFVTKPPTRRQFCWWSAMIYSRKSPTPAIYYLWIYTSFSANQEARKHSPPSNSTP